jgi:hypothetical protein
LEDEKEMSRVHDQSVQNASPEAKSFKYDTMSHSNHGSSNNARKVKSPSVEVLSRAFNADDCKEEDVFRDCDEPVVNAEEGVELPEEKKLNDEDEKLDV